MQVIDKNGDFIAHLHVGTAILTAWDRNTNGDILGGEVAEADGICGAFHQAVENTIHICRAK